ncbi:MAG: Crp/Fnr family transcriptional regulator [Clostridia bacterium]|jgi:CRP-like cAMP-binding protein|nr:Crp/Fnr family transcriptional regulator [Clostridia bacterium]MBO7398016.1 Crp/Fnr family transcriptional regulator [Clostridia bacterium]MBO7503154.1 Crp/Fnr family transcriptional regulator [Clostridia bacterium]MBO7657795.1 Crp/Fnr family transcriptional regulator [Clostridia bacterium]MBR5005889.1 Crp/Fnr family transcriptional regulator [Clostridia bacterium]
MPNNANRNITYLKNCRLFEKMTDKELRGVLETTEIRELEAGERLADETDFPRGLSVVLSGELLASNRAGEKITDLNKFAKGCVVGAASMFLSEGPFRYSSVIKATRRSKVLVIPEKKVKELIAGCPAFSLAYVEFLTGRIRFLNAKIGGYTARNAVENLRQYIAGECRASGDGTCAANYSEIARKLAVSRPTVYRAAEELEESGFLLKEGKKFKLAEMR